MPRRRERRPLLPAAAAVHQAGSDALTRLTDIITRCPELSQGRSSSTIQSLQKQKPVRNRTRRQPQEQSRGKRQCRRTLTAFTSTRVRRGDARSAPWHVARAPRAGARQTRARMAGRSSFGTARCASRPVGRLQAYHLQRVTKVDPRRNLLS